MSRQTRLNGFVGQSDADTQYAPVTVAAQALLPTSAFLPRKPEYVIDTFAAGHGWTASGPWASSNLNYTTISGWSAQALYGVTNGAGAEGVFQKVGGFTAFDPTGKHILLLVRCSKPYAVNSLKLHVSSDASAAFTNSRAWTALGSAGQMALANEWFPVIFTEDGATDTGTGPGTAIQAMKLTVSDKNNAFSILYGGLSMYSRSDKYPTGVVSMTFDDGYISHTTTVKNILSKYRYRATLFPIIGQLGNGSSATEVDLLSLERFYGWEVGAHATTLAMHSAGFPSLTGAPLRTELLSLRQWLSTRGLRSQVLAYPLGTFNEEVVAEARKLFSAGRTTGGAQKETFPPSDNMRLRALSVSVSAGTTLAAAKAAIDAAETYGHHLILTFHDIVTTPTGTSWSTADLTSLVAYIATKNIAVKPLGEVLSGA